MSSERLDFLRTVDILAGAGPDDVAAVEALCREQTYGPGAPIFREGERADSVLVVRSGEVRCHRAGAEVTRIAPGEAFGVTSFLDGGTRNVDAVAAGEVRVLVLDRAPFLTAAQSRPALLRGLVAVTGKHLRSVLDIATSRRGSRA